MGIVEGKPNDEFILRVYMINPTNKKVLLTRKQFAHQGDEDSLVDLGGGPRPALVLEPHGYAQIDQMNDMGELDFTTTYTFNRRDAGSSTVYWTLEEVSGRYGSSVGDNYVPPDLRGYCVQPIALDWLECGPDGKPLSWTR